MVKREDGFSLDWVRVGGEGTPPPPVLQNRLLIGLTAMVSAKSSAHWG